MNVKFLDLQRQHESIASEVNAAIKKVVDKQWFILGEEVKAFEKEFAAYLGVKYFVGLASGSEGLVLALRILNIGEGDEVITPVNSFVATAFAITQVGATPVFADIDEKTYQIDIKEVKKKITKRTKALLPVHLYGAPCNIDAIRTLAKQEKLFLIEDAAQAHGAMQNGERVGGFGDLAVFSFYPGKNLGAYGDGGGVATNDEELYKKLSLIRNYGQTQKYYHESIGVNSRLDELQAAILRVKLRYLEKWNTARRKNADLYKNLLGELKMQEIDTRSLSSYHLFVVEHNDREAFRGYLENNGVQTLIHYPLPISLQKCYNYLGYKKGDFPIAERIANQLVSLPMYPELTENEITYIAEKINNY